MGKVYKNKKGSSCKLCKPHKAGWEPKKKIKIRIKEKQMDDEIRQTHKDLNGWNQGWQKGVDGQGDWVTFNKPWD